MKKESIIFIVIILLGILMTLYFTNNKDNIVDKTNNETNTNKDNKPSDDVCLADYKCITIDNKEYYFSIKSEVEALSIYDYDTDSIINGKLYK